MFKALTIYRIASGWAPALEAMETALMSAKFVPCGATQDKSVGWVPPRGNEHDSMVEAIDGQRIMKLRIETKSVPGATVREKAQAEADHIAREQAEAVSAARIRDEQATAPSVQTYDNGAPMYSTTTFKDNGQPIMLTPDGKRSIFCDVADDEEPADNGARLTLGQLNDRLAPVSINVAGLSTLGFDPVEQVKASRFYRECDLPAICKAISAHVLAACATETVE